MKLYWKNRGLGFDSVALYFDAIDLENVFAGKNNKTLRETLAHRRYKKFENPVVASYSEYLDWRLGEFLLHLKCNHDSFYLNFLNRYGDGEYCQFHIEDERYLSQMGLYIYTVAGELRYIGRCLDSFRRRINQGYGTIHPKNCYIDGQATNCHLNALIAIHRAQVALWAHTMSDRAKITEAEKWLIAKYTPPWNVAR